MNTAYNRRIASDVDAINHRAARHAPANFVGKGYGSDSGINTQYRDVMGAAYNWPRDLSRVERENRAEADLKMFGSGFMDDLGQAFRYTPIGMASDAISGRDTVFSGRGIGGNSYAKVGVTMPFREVPEAGVVDFADPLNGEGYSGVSGGRMKFPLRTKVQVGNMDGSGEPPKVGCAWYASLEDFRGGRNRMMESKKIGRMTKMPDMPTDLTEDEMMFVEDLFSRSKGGAGYYGGAWYNDWDDFVGAIKEGYDTVVGVWEDYIKPVLDVVGTPVKDALISSGNPYGEAGGAFLELLGYGRPGMSGGDGLDLRMERTRMSGGRSGGASGIGGRSGGAEVGVFANAKPIPANSLGFDPKLEVEQLNAATGSTSYGDMPTSNPVGSGMSGIGGRKRRLIKNDSGASSAPIKMGEGELTGGALQDIMAAVLNGIIAGISGVPSTVSAAAKRLKKAYKREDVQVVLTYLKEHPDVLIPFLPTGMAAGAVLGRLLQTYLNMPTREDEWEMVDEALDAPPVVDMEGADGRGRRGRGVLKITHGGSKAERAGLAVSGDNSMGAIVAERGFSKKSQKEAAAVEDKAKDNMWDGEKMENVAGRSGKKINNLILQDATRGQKGVSVSGGSHPLTQVNNLKGVFGGGGEKSGMKRKGQSNAYSQLTKKIMAEKGMRLGEASAYIKANGLYKKA
jgi:hypothetical protein